MAAFSVVLLETSSRRDKRGRYPIFLRISDGRVHRTKSLSERATPLQWNKRKQEVRASHPDAERINDLIASAKAEAQAEIRRRTWEGEPLTPHDLADALWKPVTPPAPERTDFFAYADAWAARLKSEGRIGYWKRAKSVIKKLRGTVAGPLPFNAFTAEVLEAHYRRMTDELGNTRNTAIVSFRLLRTVVRRAVKDGTMQPWDDPFIKFTVPAETPTKRAKLSADDLQSIEALDLGDAPALDVTRDLFLFSTYAAGVRFGDVVQLRWSNVKTHRGTERLVYTMGKTGVERDLKLNPRAQAILDKYRTEGRAQSDGLVFPFLDGYDLSTPESVVRAVGSRNVVVNRDLKKIASLAGVAVHLTFHVSRHSFADLARRNGADVFGVSKALGHSDLKVTTRYLARLDPGAADQAIDKAFG